MKKSFILIFSWSAFIIDASATHADNDDKNDKSITKLEKSFYHIKQDEIKEDNGLLEEHSYSYSLFKWAKHKLSSTSTEQDKFPDVRISKLLELCDFQESDYNSLFGKTIEYSTGSDESSFNNYNGILTIMDVDFGTCQLKFISPQEGFDKNIQYETLRKLKKPYIFLNTWIKNKDDIVLSKGTPYAEGGRIWLDYWGYNKTNTEFVKIKAVRTPSKILSEKLRHRSNKT